MPLFKSALSPLGEMTVKGSIFGADEAASREAASLRDVRLVVKLRTDWELWHDACDCCRHLAKGLAAFRHADIAV